MDDAPTSIKKHEKPTGQAAVSDPEYDIRRRLIICLDGTWNKRDSGTNIYHLSNLVKEGAVGELGDRWFQMVHYDEGVGTGLLTSVRGGAFGIGLSENVREAYDWLVEKYRDGDEIYVFGFSRGAFTARSLVGLLAKCGLLYRGAPISPAQLWRAYRILGRHSPAREGNAPARKGMERIAGRHKMPFRPLRLLKRDAWEGPAADPAPAAPVNRTEQLLHRWSRRVPITCLGVFDTVASMGLDALSIPWLRDKTAQFHDTKLSSLVVNGFQALAIDEHRANFAHVAWHRPLNPIPPPQEMQGKVEQRWFVGAHANIGGGYEDDVLSQFTLAWFMQECQRLGLVFRTDSDDPDPAIPPLLPSCIPLFEWTKGKLGMEKKPPQVRDSYAEIARGIWKNIIRSKRHYRRIGPPPEFQNGVAVQSVNERLDESVLKLMQLDCEAGVPGKSYDPPNLWEYRQRAQRNLPAPPHRYYDGLASKIWTAFWLVLVAGAGVTLARWFGVQRWDCFASSIVVVAAILDHAESWLNHTAALRPDGLAGERRRAFVTFFLFFRVHIFFAILLSAIYWTAITVWPWLFRLNLTSHLVGLFWLYVLLLVFLAAGEWCRVPMAEAGFGAITKLQRANSPAKVLQVLRGWLALGSAPPSTKQSFIEDEKKQSDSQLLVPVAHTIWRDLLAFIPVYSILIFFGTWVFLSLVWRKYWADPVTKDLPGVLLDNSPAFWLALALTLVIALADYIEDSIHLVYLKIFPRTPAGPLVYAAFTATVLKFVFFIVGFLIFLVALGWLTVLEAPKILTPASGAVRALLVLGPALLLVLSLILKLRARRSKGEDGVQTPTAVPKQTFVNKK